jgi:hypothetical protein
MISMHHHHLALRSHFGGMVQRWVNKKKLKFISGRGERLLGGAKHYSAAGQGTKVKLLSIFIYNLYTHHLPVILRAL